MDEGGEGRGTVFDGTEGVGDGVGDVEMLGVRVGTTAD